MWIVLVGRPTCRTEAVQVVLDVMPAPHADLVATFARQKVLVRKVELFAAERADLLVEVVEIVHWPLVEILASETLRHLS